MAEKKIGIRITAKGDQARRELGRLRDQFLRTRKAAEAAGLGFEKMDRAAKAITFRAAVNNMKDLVSVGQRAIQFVDDMVMRSIKLSGANQTLKFNIDKARDASKGFVDDLTLTRLAVDAQRAGLVKNSAEFAKMADVATRTALQIGRDPVDSLERLTLGLAKNEQEILDELGVLTRAEDAYKKYAFRIGKTADVLSDAEKQTAQFTIRMEELERKAAETNVTLKSHQTAWLELRADWEEAKTLVTRLPGAIEDVNKSMDGNLESAAKLFPAYTVLTSGVIGLTNALADLNRQLNPKKLETGVRSNIERLGLRRRTNLEESRRNQAGINELKERELEIEKRLKDEEHARNMAARREFDRRSGKGKRKKFEQDALGDRTGKLFQINPAIAPVGEEEQKLIQDNAATKDLVNRLQSESNELMAKDSELRHERIDAIQQETEVLSEGRREWIMLTADLRKSTLSERDILKQRVWRARVAQETINELTAGGVEVFGMAVQASGASAERQARLMNRAAGIQAIGIGALETVKAASAAASFNVVQAVLHSAAAAVAFTKGGLLLSGKMDNPGAAAGGGGGGGGVGGGIGGGGGGGGPSTPGPISRPQILDRDGGDEPPGTGASQQRRGTNINQVNITTLATNDDELFTRLRQGLDDAERKVGNA